MLDGATVPLTAGETEQIWIGNIGEGQLELGAPSSSPGGPTITAYWPDDVVAIGGPLVRFDLSCADQQGNPLTGDVLIKVPDVSQNTIWSVTLHCAPGPDEQAAAGGLPATGQREE